MAARSGSRSHEGMYSSSPPSPDPHDPFSNSQAADGRYFDGDSDHDYRGNRDTYGSDSSNINDDDRYYEHGGGYDYGE